MNRWERLHGKPRAQTATWAVQTRGGNLPLDRPIQARPWIHLVRLGRDQWRISRMPVSTYGDFVSTTLRA